MDAKLQFLDLIQYAPISTDDIESSELSLKPLKHKVNTDWKTLCFFKARLDVTECCTARTSSMSPKLPEALGHQPFAAGKDQEHVQRS